MPMINNNISTIKQWLDEGGFLAKLFETYSSTSRKSIAEINNDLDILKEQNENIILLYERGDNIISTINQLGYYEGIRTVLCKNSRDELINVFLLFTNTTDKTRMLIGIEQKEFKIYTDFENKRGFKEYIINRQYQVSSFSELESIHPRIGSIGSLQVDSENDGVYYYNGIKWRKFNTLA